MTHRRAPILAIAVFALVLGVGALLVRQAERLHRVEQRAAAASIAAGAAFSLEQQLSRSLSATYALATLLRHYGEIADFASLAAQMLPMYGGVSALQLVPEGVIREVYPLSGNEAVVGYDVLGDPARRADVMAAIESRQLALDGPFALRQGGQGLVARLAVFLPRPDGGERLWGLVAVVIRLPALLEASQLGRLPAAGFDYALSHRRSGSGAREIFAGTGAADPPEAVEFPVKVPNGEWTLSVAPTGGWKASPLHGVGDAIAAAVALAMALLSFRVLRQPEILRREVAARTAELATANLDLARDVAERRRAEDALRITQFAVDRAPEPIVWTGADGAVLYANEAALRLAGLTFDEALGRKIWELDRGLTEESWRARWDEVSRLGSVSVETTLRPPLAPPRTIQSTISRVVVDGRALNVAFVRDVTEQRRTEEQLRQAQKMEAVGLLAGGVAHDFNNLLAGILGYASVLQAESAPGGVVREAADTILEAGERAAALTKQLLGFARRGKFQDTAVDVHAIVAEVASLLGRTIEKNVSIVQRLRAPRAVVRGDPGQIHQAVLNLAVNARDAMPEGGELAFETAVVEPEAGPGGAASPRLLALTVADTGLGIPREIRDRVFEPFFTTKEAGAGTGMGLAMVYGTAKNHGGAISVESEPGRGSRFTLQIPLHDGPAEPRPGALPPRRGSGRLLVVDDEEVVRNAAARIARSLGYEVLVASGGREAVRLFRERTGEIDLVILDMVMPDMDGRACFRALREADPGVRAVLSSGYGRDGKVQELLDEGMLEFVQKPFEMADLGRAISRAIESAAAAKPSRDGAQRD